MSDTSNNQPKNADFGEIIFSYSRAQAIEDGVLIDAGAMAKEAGFRVPFALTIAVWDDCVAWSDRDSQEQVHQDQCGRLWDLLFMAAHGIRTSRACGDRLLFELYRVPRDGQSTAAEGTTLKLIVGPGDGGEPVMTIMEPDED